MGEIAALATSVCWSFTGLLFTAGGRRVGSRVVNLARLLAAVGLLLLLHRLGLGHWLPAGAGLDRWAWLAASGLVGLALGDSALFQAMLFIGPRLSSLLMALAPIFSTLLAWLFLGERLAGADLLAIALTVSGVGWVVLERGGAPNGPARPNYALGVGLGVAASVAQAGGLILAKPALADGFPALSATLMRMLAGAAALWLAALITGNWRQVGRLRSDGRAALAIFGGTVVGPVTGVTLSQYAIQNAPVGIASTLMALTPVFMLPLVWWVYREQASPRAVAGTVLALAGVALIFLV